MKKSKRFDHLAALRAVEELRTISIWLGVGHSFDPEEGYLLEVRIDQSHVDDLTSKIPKSFHGFPVRMQVLEGVVFS